MKEWKGINKDMTIHEKIAQSRSNRGADVGDISTEAAMLMTAIRGPVANNREPSEDDFREMGKLTFELCKRASGSRMIEALRAFETSLRGEVTPAHPNLVRLLSYLSHKMSVGDVGDPEMLQLVARGRQLNPDNGTVNDDELKMLFPRMDAGTRQRLAKDQAKVPFRKKKTGPK